MRTNKLQGLVLVLAIMPVANAADIDRKAFDHTIATIRGNSFYQVTDEDIYRGAIQGVMQMLDARNTPAVKKNSEQYKFAWNARNVLLTPDQVANLEINTSGSLAGIGISLSYDPDKGINRPVIIDVLEGGGRDAGLEKNDQILKINGKSIDQFASFDDMVYAIRGPASTQVGLTVLRGSDVREFTVTRKIIKIPNVEGEMLPGGTAYLKLRNINPAALQDIRQDLDKFIAAGATRLILDLRENVAGLYETGRDVIGLFVKKNDTIYQERRGGDPQMKTVRADKDGIAAGMKVAVLVNQNTASIAEALATVFKHRVGAVLIGSTTFGKASIENLFDAGDGYKLLVTVGMLYDRDGKTWHGAGIEPDIQVPAVAGGGNNDNVLALAKDYIQRM